jgi:pimeloyl-ACP methyl ester carboxylesterase
MIPFEEFGGAGPVLHFAHANGFPPGAYQPLLKCLAGGFSVMAMRMRPLWSEASPDGLSDWRPLADDLACFLQEQSLSGVFGVGHSVGGTTTLRLALQRPDLFDSLVLIDPVIFTPQMTYSWIMLNHLGLSSLLLPFSRNARRRRAVFDSPQMMFDNYRHKSVFEKIDDTGLQAYVDAISCQQPDGRYGLSYPPEWEARIYATGMLADLDIWRGLPSLKLPLLILRGAESSTFWESTARRLLRRLPSIQLQVIPRATHLLPLEFPAELCIAIRRFWLEQHPNDRILSP